MWIVIGSILFILLMVLLKHICKETFEREAQLEQYFKKGKVVDRKKNESRGETQCREVAEKIFGKPFAKIRPDFLRNNVTGKNLELDIFNEELRVAIEYNGQQHYKYIPFFHKNYEHFLNQKYRDEIKKMLCEQNDIKLIEVPHTVDLPDIETYIRVEARKLNFKV